MTTDITPSEPTGGKPTKVYLVYRDDEVFRASLDVDLMCQCFEYYSDKDIEEQYTWSMTSKGLDA